VGKVRDGIDDAIREWVGRQHLFFVATAPSGDDGHVNVSPKGMGDTFAFLDGDRCAYLDLTGSGAETVAHLRQNGRITLMWCAFEGPARIVRFHGVGRVVLPSESTWDDLVLRFGEHRGARSIIVVDVERVADSCGYSVPRMDFVAERTRLDDWASDRSDDELIAYRARKNAVSIDGLPAFDPPTDIAPAVPTS
jgi:hypothetical protein